MRTRQSSHEQKDRGNNALSATLNRLPAWLQRHGVACLCLLVVAGMTLYLTYQSIDLIRLLRSSPAVTAPPAATAANATASLDQVENLFGTPARRAGDQPPPTTSQQITLLASFVSPQSGRSAAIIATGGGKPKRIEVGGEINASTRLKAVLADHVILERSGKEESLRFPTLRSRSPSQAPELPSEPLEQFQEDQVQALQQSIDELQERMDSNGEEPLPTDPPEAEPAP